VAIDPTFSQSSMEIDYESISIVKIDYIFFKGRKSFRPLNFK
jgi:hypothetical protein